MSPVKRGRTVSTCSSVGRTSLVAMTWPSASSVSVSSPKRMVKSYALVASSIRPASLVASPSAIGSTPLASGSSVPPWPTLVLGSPASRSSRLTALTACVEPSPTGLSRMIQPWSISRADAEQRQETAYDVVDHGRDDAAHHVGVRGDCRKHEQKQHEDQQRIAADAPEADREGRRKQSFDDVPAVERGNGQQVEHAEEDIDEHEVERIGCDQVRHEAVQI